MNTLAVLIHAANNENLIKDCIDSISPLNVPVYVADQSSTDDTAAIAKRSGAEILSFPSVPYVEQLREDAIRKVPAEWVLILDPDERLTPELAKEVTSTLSSTDHTSFKIPRKNIFGKKWLKHGGWWPDHQMRLIKKDSLQSWPKVIHSTPLISGTQGLLTSPLLHYFHGDIEQMVTKTGVFEDIESDLLFKAGRQANTPIFFRKYLGELTRRLVKKGGFLDGQIGIIESIYQAFSKTITYLFLYEKKERRSV